MEDKAIIEWHLYYIRNCIETADLYPELDKWELHICMPLQDFCYKFFCKNGFTVKMWGTVNNGGSIIYYNKSQLLKLKTLKAELEASLDF